MDDIIQEILLLLPVKDVNRCKCLSKKWYHFISFNGYFRRKYLSNLTSSSSLPMLGLLFNRQEHIHNRDFEGFYSVKYSVGFVPINTNTNKLKIEDVEFRGAFHSGFDLTEVLGLGYEFEGYYNNLYEEAPEILASSNGFLLCGFGYGSPSSYYVYNPITGERAALPRSPTELSSNSHRWWETKVSFLCQGDCLSLNKVSYKIVRRLRTFTSTLSMEVFNSESFEWKTLTKDCHTLRLYSSYPDIINEEGIVYMLASDDSTWMTNLIVAADEKKEQLELIKIPEGSGGSWIELLDEVIFYVRQVKREFQILVMEEKEWYLKYKINSEALEKEVVFFDPSYVEIEFLGFHPANPHISLFQWNGLVLSYNAENLTAELICDLNSSNYPRERGCFMFFPYIWRSLPPFFP